uniref:BEN domain-containing protein n=2 Tax=Caenorhabditis tropicalis TaxID=1561998 RepID=A0A1I7T416_9PELO
MRDSISAQNETGFRRMTGQPPSRHLRQSSEDDNIRSKSPLPGPPAGMLKIRIRNPYGSDSSFISEQNNLTTPPKEVRFHYGVPLKPNVNSPFPCICLNYYRPEACRGSNRVQEKWTTAECRRFARNILKMRDREEQAVSPTVQPISNTSVTARPPVTFSQKYNERPRKSKIIPNETPLHSIPNEIEKPEQNSPVPSSLSSLLPQLLSPEDSLQAIDRNNCRSFSTVQNFTYEHQNDEAEIVDEEMWKEEVVETFSHVDETVEEQNKRLMNQENMKRYENSTNSFTDGKTDGKSSPSLSTYQTYMEKPDHHQQNSQKFNQNHSVIPEIEEIELCKPNQEYELRDYMNSNATTMNQVNIPVLEFFGAVDVETHTIHQITRYNSQHVSDIEDEAENLSQNSVKQKRIGNVPIKKESKPNMKLILLRTRSKTELAAAQSGRQRDNSVILIDEDGKFENKSNLSILPPAKKQRLSRFEEKKQTDA